jgi:hypothetical protein
MSEYENSSFVRDDDNEIRRDEKMIPIKKMPPDGGYGWAILIAAFVSFILNFFCWYFNLII